MDNIDWYCDECNAYLNDQPGFDGNNGVWECAECGYSNSIHDYDVLSEEEYNDFNDSEFDSYNEYVEDRDSGEALSAYDAALIWVSHGKDEDYTFGYSEEELEDALDE